MAGYCDLHAHFLPGLDDGATEITVSLEMIAGLQRAGFSELVATPHQRAQLFLPERASIEGALAEVLSHLGTDTSVVGSAAENFWDEVLLGRLQSAEVPAYPGGRAFLFEVEPQLMPPGLEETLFRLRVKGLLPVLAHPERYASVQQDPTRAAALGRQSALLLDVAALEGAHGRAAMKTARVLVREGLVHAAASDVHRPEDVAGVMAGIAWLKKEMGEDHAERLLGENPRRILAGELPD